MVPSASRLLVFRSSTSHPKLLGGLLVGFVGVLFVTGIWNGFGTSQLLGIGACLLAVISFGVAFPYSSRHLAARGDSPVSLAAGQLICGVSQLLPFAIVIGGPVGHPHSSSVLGLLALGLIGTGFAYVLYFHIAGHTSAAIASSVTYLTRSVAVIRRRCLPPANPSLGTNRPVALSYFSEPRFLRTIRIRRHRQASRMNRSGFRAGPNDQVERQDLSASTNLVRLEINVTEE